MSVFDKMSNGWQLAMSSFKVLNANKQLIIFPILSGISSTLIIATFWGVLFGSSRWNFNYGSSGQGFFYLALFLFYILNYFIVVYFNMALMYCTKLYFDGEEVSVAKGLQFSAGRVHTIFAWAVFSATIGLLLRIIRDNSGWVTKLITAGFGLVWSAATFLVIPVLAYENLGPIDAVKRSAELMTQKWGEGIGSSFSFGLIFLLPGIIFVIVAMAASTYINESAGIFILVICMLFLFVLSSTLRSIFISALYSSIQGSDNTHFDQHTINGAFE